MFTTFLVPSITAMLVIATIIFLNASLVYIGIHVSDMRIDPVVLTMVSSLLTIVGYRYLNQAMTRLTQRIFFEGRYDPEIVLKQLTSIMVQEIHIDKLARSLLTALNAEIGLASSALVVTQGQAVKSVEHVGFTKPIPFSADSLAQLLHFKSQLVVLGAHLSQEDQAYFRQNDISLILPLQVQDERIGFLLLGAKSSGKQYGAHDQEFLETLAPQCAIAIKNAQSYREIQEFNMTLEGKVAERTKELKASQAEQLRLKDEFVFIATHDLATPVTAISGFTAMINARQEKVSAELQANLTTISEASNRLKVLVNDLLEVARSDSGTIKIQLTRVDASKVITAAVRQLEPLAQEKQVKVTIALIEDAHVMADPQKLAEVVENLMSNAIKYNRRGGALTIAATAKEKSLVLEFKDTGLGIPDSEQGKVFSKFFRSDTAEVRARPGTGLGLFVARMLTHKMGGTITFSSKEGQGTTFWLEFAR